MNTTISLGDKKAFIKWLARYRKMKRSESKYILNYLLADNNHHILSKVHFVEDIPERSRGMVMSTTDTEKIPFRFYNGNSMTADAEKAFNNLRLYPEERMYIQINFTDRFNCTEYLAVLEDIEFSRTNEEGVIIVSEDIERLVSVITASTNRKSLLDEIDKALDNGDEELFMQLSGMLNKQEELKAVSFSA